MTGQTASLSAPRRRLWDFYTLPLALWTLLVCYSTLSPPGDLPAAAFDISDKLGHAVLFAVFAALLLRAWARAGRIGPVAAAGTVLISAVWGYYIECLQALTDYRSYDLKDAAADAIGALAGVAALMIVRRALRPAPQGADQ